MWVNVVFIELNLAKWTGQFLHLAKTLVTHSVSTLIYLNGLVHDHQTDWASKLVLHLLIGYLSRCLHVFFKN